MMGGCTYRETPLGALWGIGHVGVGQLRCPAKKPAQRRCEPLDGAAWGGWRENAAERAVERVQVADPGNLRDLEPVSAA